jgi:two-component system, chemotaxis family, chemotaxis protein CheY
MHELKSASHKFCRYELNLKRGSPILSIGQFIWGAGDSNFRTCPQNRSYSGVLFAGCGAQGDPNHRTGTDMTAIILAVDDSASMRQMVSFTLKHAGYQVVEATDGVEALDYARGNPVSLVLTDVNMPRMDGIALVRELRQLAAYKFTPMLVLTTEASREKKLEGKQAGATGWLVKPFNPEKLLATIAKVL